MNNKEFLNALSAKMNMSVKEVQQLAEAFIAEAGSELAEGTPLTVQGFGNFEVKKKMERIVVNPGTKQRMLVPPKLVIGYKASALLKERVND